MLDVPQICRAVSDAVRPLAPFDIDAYGVGAFPDRQRPRTVWIGTDDGTEQMIALHDAVETELAKIGFRTEGRRFRPHLTIGRVRGDRGGLAELAELIGQEAAFDGGRATVFELSILSSTLTREGPIYEPLGHAELLGIDPDAPLAGGPEI